MMRYSCVILLACVGTCVGGWLDWWGSRDGEHNIKITSFRNYQDSFYNPDTLFIEDRQIEEGSWWSSKSNTVCYPSRDPWFHITRFNVTDLVGGGKGGFVSITRGGIGETTLCLQLQTQRGGGYDFLIHIWGIAFDN